MPRVDMHTHMDAKVQYDKCVEAMDQWGGTNFITLGGLFWFMDKDVKNAFPDCVRQFPVNDLLFAK